MKTILLIVFGIGVVLFAGLAYTGGYVDGYWSGEKYGSITCR